jgi:hypothetical protein
MFLVCLALESWDELNNKVICFSFLDISLIILNNLFTDSHLLTLNVFPPCFPFFSTLKAFLIFIIYALQNTLSVTHIFITVDTTTSPTLNPANAFSSVLGVYLFRPSATPLPGVYRF